MAVGIAVSNESKEYKGKMTTFVMLSCVTAAMGGLIFGYDIGVSGGVTSMEPFLRRFFPEVYTRMKNNNKISNYCKFDSHLLTSFTSSLYIAGLVACIIASPVTRSFGRKTSIMVGCVSFLTGAALGGAALNIYMLIIGRMLLGVGIGFTNQAIPLYLSEMAPSKYRGAMSNGFQLTVGVGYLCANLTNFGTEKLKGDLGWRISLSMAGMPALILTIGTFFLPETPNSLIQRFDDHEKAKLMLQRVRGVVDVQDELNDLIKANAVSKTIKHPFKNILERKYRPQLIMAIAIPFFTQVTGINVTAFYAPILFRTIGFGESASLLSGAALGVIGICSNVMAMFIVDRFGRKILFMIGGIQMLITQVTIGVLMAVKVGDQNKVENGYAYTILVLVFAYVVAFGVSWGPLNWLIPSEIFPLEIRSAGQSINIAVGFVFTFIIAQTFLSMLCKFKAGIFFFFGGWVIVMTVFVHLFLPETKGLPIEKMDQVWRDHWFWKNIVEEKTEKDSMSVI
ncbi:Hexose carrier protein hex6 [Ranunculus cassubicifolius]